VRPASSAQNRIQELRQKGSRKPKIIQQIGEVKSLLIGLARFLISCLLRRDIISITSTRIPHQRQWEKGKKVKEKRAKTRLRRNLLNAKTFNHSYAPWRQRKSPSAGRGKANFTSEKRWAAFPVPKANSKQSVGRNEISVNTTKIHSHTKHIQRCSLKCVCMRI